MIARRMLRDTYADFEPEDLPVDLHRLRRDLEITRDQRISDAIEEVTAAHSIVQSIIESVADKHPLIYRAQPKPVRTDVPDKITKYLNPGLRRAVVASLVRAENGLTLVELCDEHSLTSPPVHMATKRYLAYLRTKGCLKTQGPGGKGLRYVSTSRLKQVLAGMLAEGEIKAGGDDD